MYQVKQKRKEEYLVKMRVYKQYMFEYLFRAKKLLKDTENNQSLVQ